MKRGPDSIVIIRAPLLTDTRDNSLWRDWANASRTTWTNCVVQPYRMAEKLNAEDNVDREYMATSIKIFAPRNCDVVYTDRLEVSARGYEDVVFNVLGLPGAWHDLNGSPVYTGIIAQARLG